MISSRLSLPDLDDEHDKPGYSGSVAGRLREAYQAITGDHLNRVVQLIRPLYGTTMGVWQELRVLYLLSVAAAVSGQREALVRALDYVDEALDIARELEDLNALATFGYQGASVCHNLQWFAKAGQYYAGGLEAMHAMEPSMSDPTTALQREFDLLMGMAIEAFLCADHSHARQLIAAAKRIALPQPGIELRVARMEWLESMLARWNSAHAEALHLAINAFDTYAGFGDPISRARAGLLVAESYLDFAYPFGRNPLPPSSERARFVQMAERQINAVVASTRMTGDRSAEGLALLAHARFARAAQCNEDPLVSIAQAEQIARELGDLPLLAQAYTARGAEFTARRESSQAMGSFISAIDALRNSDAVVYAIFAKRAQLMGEELDDRE